MTSLPPSGLLHVLRRMEEEPTGEKLAETLGGEPMLSPLLQEILKGEHPRGLH